MLTSAVKKARHAFWIRGGACTHSRQTLSAYEVIWTMVRAHIVNTSVAPEI
jgi:hypothetical protein